MTTKKKELLDSFSIKALLDEKDEIKKLLKQYKDNEEVCKNMRGWRLKINKRLKEKGYDKSRHT